MRTALAIALFVAAATRAFAAAPSSCESCHADAARVGDGSLRVVDTHVGAHAESGLSCHDCHGGNPDPALADDAAAAMDRSFGADPYRGSPERRDVPAFCGHCHSDPTFMRRFDPGARVDQEREYWTSHHGRALERGDAQVPTCVDCHGSHDVRRIDDLESPVYPTHVAETCAGCHANPATFAGRATDDGRPIPIDQYALWRQSVHATALLEREDPSAPTCNDCHGNHGATPPDVQSVANICGQCHDREARLFLRSPKGEGFRRHNELLAAVGEESCAACHAEPEPQASLHGVRSLGECTACHGNHGIVRPTIAMLAPLPETPCEFCHEAPGPRYEALLGSEEIAEHYRAVRASLLEAADALGLEGTARFDWLVDRASTLPFHSLPPDGAATADGAAPSRLRPEFERLFGKFRIGKTHFTYRDPATGELREAPVRRCSTCHAAEPLLAESPRGLKMAGQLLARIRELTAVTAMAERTVLRARRGGVETGDALIEIDESVDAQVELEVLVHGFALEPESEFAVTHANGMEHANAALSLSQRAVEELGARRRGLVGFLVVVAIVLVGLGAKIRQVSARAEREAGASAP